MPLSKIAQNIGTNTTLAHTGQQGGHVDQDAAKQISSTQLPVKMAIEAAMYRMECTLITP